MRNIGGYILAGGKSSRLGSPKWRTALGGRRLVDIVAAAMAPVVAPPITLVGDLGDDPSGFRLIRDTMVDGKYPAVAGPLVGLLSAIEDSRDPWIAVLACDLPFVRSELIAGLVSLIDDNADAIVPVQPDGRLQPLCAVYRKKTCNQAILDQLSTGRSSMLSLLDLITVRKLEPVEYVGLEGSERFFFNVNTPEDLATARTIFETPPA
ncbi:MAG TPA: molybdenum cofactor guanylyltransferase [Pyrinomonadaceae bacterium]|nr:molybdenum cofactor guanylyltransferase [Pyrinomonadaceae bacterium]HMP64202.1 molybdenum cofactor guanylyltransferase [Pyrinomonadaceae bacterium]